MANRFRDPVGYRPFHVQPLLAEGLIAVDRPGGEWKGGELEQRVAAGLFRLAEEAGVFADRQAASAGRRAGEADALAGAPGFEFDPGTVGGHGQARGGSFAPEVNAAIDRAAQEEGVDATTLRTIAQIESGGNPKARNPTSSAGGLFQFIDSTAASMGLADKFDPYQAARAAARLAKHNAAGLRKVLGRDASPGELYLAHQQGLGGAAKLLRNPDAPATKIVGGDAVRLNGGKPGMTAGQFARLWIDKAENGYVMPSDPSQITTAAIPAGGGVRLTGGKFRPTGSDTIYGRAYDEAGTRTYLQELETEMRSTTSQLFDQHKDDPVALAKALGDLKGALAKDHVFGEIAAEYSTGFDRIAESYLGQARENLAAKVKAQDEADFVTRTAALQTDVQQRIAQFDPKNPNAADAIASAQAVLDQQYDDAVARGVLAPDTAARAKLESRRNTALGFYGKQAEALDADGVKAMREKMKADMADGGVAGLDGEGYQSRSTPGSKTSRRKARRRRSGEVRFPREGRQPGGACRSRLRRAAGRSRQAGAGCRRDAGGQSADAGDLREDLRRPRHPRHEHATGSRPCRRPAEAIWQRANRWRAAYAGVRRGHACRQGKGCFHRSGFLCRRTGHRAGNADADRGRDGGRRRVDHAGAHLKSADDRRHAFRRHAALSEGRRGGGSGGRGARRSGAGRDRSPARSSPAPAIGRPTSWPSSAPTRRSLRKAAPSSRSAARRRPPRTS
jgi:hypothetical protein